MIRIKSVMAIMLAISALALGQHKSKRTVSNTRDEQALRELERKYADAVLRQDLTTLDLILAGDFIATSSRGEVRSKTQEIDDIEPSSDYAIESFDVDDINVRLFGTAAVVTGRSVLKVRYKNQSSSSVFRYTRIYVRRQGHWQAIAQQLTRVPSR